MILATLLSLQSHAAEVQVAMSTPIMVVVDGVVIDTSSGGQVVVVPGLAAGKHTIETRTMFGKTTALKQIELGALEQIKYEYRKKELWEIGRYQMQPPPAPVVVGAPTTTTTTTTVSTNGLPGMGLTISDGQDTVSIGANFPGMGSSVTVTETTSTTVVTDGAVSGAPTAKRYPFDPGAFEALYRQMRETPFDSDRTEFLKSATRANELTVAQLKRLLSTYTHDNSKVEAVQVAAPSVMDPHNAFQLNDAFTFSSSATEAQAAFH